MPCVAISIDAVPRPWLRRRMTDALADLLRNAPDGPWLLEIERAHFAEITWTLRLQGLRRSVIQTVQPDHHNLPDLLRLVAGVLNCAEASRDQ